MRLRSSVLNLGRFPPDRLIRLAQLQEDNGYDVFWYADERFFREVYSGLTVAALHTSRIHIGTMVTDPYVRHPAVTAMGIATLDELSDQRAILGVGAGVSGHAEMQVERRKPARAMREMIELNRELLASGSGPGPGDTVDFDGDVVRFQAGHLDFQPVRSEVPVYIASNGPLGLALAGEVAAGAVMQSAVADSLIDWFVEQVRIGAERANRDLADVDLTARVNLSIAADSGSGASGSEASRAAKDLMRPTIARSMAVQYPEYGTFRKAGLQVPTAVDEAVASIGYTHDTERLAPVAAMVPDEFVDAVTLAGTVDEVTENAIRMVEHGITHFMIYPLAADDDIERVITQFAQDVMPAVAASVGQRFRLGDERLGGEIDEPRKGAGSSSA